MRSLSRTIFPALVLCLMAGGASADQPPSDLSARLNAAAAQERALQDRVAKDNVQVAALFGESDEEKAAREQHEQNQDQGIATLNQRVGDVENSMRSLTGQVEQLDHRIQQLNERMDRMQKDFDYKICALTAQQLGASAAPGDDNALPCNAPSASAGMNVNPAPQNFSQNAAPASGPPQHLAPEHLAPGPGTLGTIPSNTALPLPPPEGQGDMPPPAPPSFKPEFDAAMVQLTHQQYDQALAGFRAFVDKHPADPLAPQALYWAGDVHYVQKDYEGASHLFAEGIKKYPTSARAPDSMLKLGESLIANNQKKEGCTALAALPARYPTASKAVATKAAAERKALCTK